MSQIQFQAKATIAARMTKTLLRGRQVLAEQAPAASQHLGFIIC